ncbi:MAG: phage GP46 family protein [Elusimicrobiales bacterium]
MKDLKINIEHGRGRLSLETTGTLLNNIFMSINMLKGSWWFNPDFGSRLHEIAREKDTTRAEMLARSYAEEALRWLVETKRAQSVAASTARTKGGLVLTVTAVSAAGEEVSFEKFVRVGA